MAHFSARHWFSVLSLSMVAEVSCSVIRQGIMRLRKASKSGSVVLAWIKNARKNSRHLPCSALLRCREQKGLI